MGTAAALLSPRELLLESQTLVAELVVRIRKEGIHHVLRLLLGVRVRILEVPRAHARGVASDQGLTLVHFSAQPEHALRSFVTETSGLISKKVLKLIKKVD